MFSLVVQVDGFTFNYNCRLQCYYYICLYFLSITFCLYLSSIRKRIYFCNRYTWLKDGVVLNTSSKENAGRMTIASGVGSLMIHPAIESDAGNYQCKVQNPCGTSLSVIAQLHYAFIEPFPKLDAPEKKTVGEGRSLKLECNPPRSVPKAKVSWILLSAEDGDESVNGAEDEDQFNSVILNERITMDYSGKR